MKFKIYLVKIKKPLTFATPKQILLKQVVCRERQTGRKFFERLETTVRKFQKFTVRKSVTQLISDVDFERD